MDAAFFGVLDEHVLVEVVSRITFREVPVLRRLLRADRIGASLPPALEIEVHGALADYWFVRGDFRADPAPGHEAVDQDCRCLLYTSDAADDLLCVDLG